jgi:bifunctional non-homologous end joining protein LigD
VGEKFVVNVAYGRRGSTLQIGTKTQVPVSWEEAQTVFDAIIRQKKAKGYTESESGTPYLHSDKQVSGIQCQLLNPIRDDEVDSLVKSEDWCMQEKFDGQRMLVQKKGAALHGINRKGQVVGLPSTVVHSANTIPYDFIIDGECLGERLVVFDLLEFNGKDCRHLFYGQRLVELINLLASGMAPNLPMIETAHTPENKARMLMELREQKAEGVVFKLLDAPYTPGRPSSGGAQLKHKFYATLSAVVSKINPQRSVKSGSWMAKTGIQPGT